jgi:hypothetical protein
VPEYWLADPKARLVEVYTWSNGEYALLGQYTGNALVTIGVCQHHEPLEPLLLPERRHNGIATDSNPLILLARLKLVRHYSGVHTLSSQNE